MKICLLGLGFVGSAVSKKLAQKHDLTVVASSKSPFKPEYFDLVINCAGVSKKYGVEKDFDAAWDHEKVIFDRILEMQNFNPMLKLLHISSICVTEDTNYGEIKRITERQATRFDYCILRLGGLVGDGLSKNVVFDWIQGKPIRTSVKSVYNFISIEEVANIIDYLVDNWRSEEIINVGASESIVIEDLFQLRNFPIQLFPGSELVVENYNFDVSELQKFYPMKTSKEYVEEYLTSLEKV